MAAQFPVASLTCSELRKFTDLHRGGRRGGPGDVRCQNLVPAFPDLRLHWGYLEASYPRRQTEGLGLGRGEEEINSCQQQAQIPPDLCSERAGRELGESWENRKVGSAPVHSRVASWNNCLQETGDQPAQMYFLPGPWGGRGVMAHTQHCRW